MTDALITYVLVVIPLVLAGMLSAHLRARRMPMIHFDE
jgi:hypothetical protein